MPVYHITITDVRGGHSSWSRPVVAPTAAEAIEQRESELGLAEGHGFAVSVRQAHDPEGLYERALLDAARRRAAHGW